MFPLFPSFKPSLNGSLVNKTTPAASNDEAEISAMEQEQQNYINLWENIAQDTQPIGTVETETRIEESEQSDDDEANDSSESEPDHDSDEDPQDERQILR